MSNAGKSTRLPKNRRAPMDQLPGMRLMARDQAVVGYVCAYRALTAPLIALLLDGTSDLPVSSRLLHRLKLLYHWQYLDRFPLTPPMGGGATFAYLPAARGAELLTQETGVIIEEKWNVNDNRAIRGHLDHLLDANAVRASLQVGARCQEVALVDWRDDLSFRKKPIQVSLGDSSGQLSEAGLVPDGFCLAQSQRGVIGLALELDRGTETVRSEGGGSDWTTKCRKYLHWYHRGDYCDRVGVRGFRVLVVAKGERRLANLKQAVKMLGDRSMFYFALFGNAADPKQVLSAQIWQRAGSDGLLRLLD